MNVDKFVIDYATGNTSIAGQLDVSKNLVINKDKFIVYYETGDTSIAGQLDVSKNLIVNVDKLVVDYATGDTGIAGQLDLSKNFVVNTDKFIVYHDTGNVHVAGTIDISQNLIINNNAFTVDYNGNVDISNNCYIGGSLTIEGAVIQKSDLSIIGNLSVVGDTKLQGYVNINDKIFIDTSGNTSIAGQLDVSKNFVVNQDTFVVDVSKSKVGINVASPVYELDVNGSIATQCVIIYDDDDNNGVFAHRNNKNNTDFALLQTSAGKTRINCKNGSGNIIFTHGSTDVKQEFDSDGNVIIQGNLFSYSDIRIKTNIETIQNALDKVTSLRGVTYNMIKDIKENPNTAQKHVGLIAQEVETIIPEAVKEENGFKTVAYGNLVSVLIEAVKELKQKIDFLNNNKFDNIKLLQYIYLYQPFNFWNTESLKVSEDKPVTPLHVNGSIIQTGVSTCNLKTTIIDSCLRINFNNIEQINNNIEININNNSNFTIDISNNCNIIINDISTNSIGQIGEIYILKNTENSCLITFDSKMKFVINTKPNTIDNEMVCIKYTILKTNLITCRFEIFD